MIFLLVILTFIVGIGISACQDWRETRAQETESVSGLVASPVLVRARYSVPRPRETKTGNLWVG